MRNETSDKKEFVLPANHSLQIEQGGGNIFFESGGEFILPDYMPKVQKVLRMEARVLPPTRYMSSGEAQMSGSVLHTLIYIGEEGEIIVDAGERGGRTSARELRDLVENLSCLFAGGELTEDDRDAAMQALTEAYWIAKNNAKKYSNKK